MDLSNLAGKTLGEIAALTGANLDPYHADKLVITIKKATNFYFSGLVLFHLSVEDKSGGMMSGCSYTYRWPFYLIDDEGKLKIRGAQC